MVRRFSLSPWDKLRKLPRAWMATRQARNNRTSLVSRLTGHVCVPSGERHPAMFDPSSFSLLGNACYCIPLDVSPPASASYVAEGERLAAIQELFWQEQPQGSYLLRTRGLDLGSGLVRAASSFSLRAFCNRNSRCIVETIRSYNVGI
jgi:hypothetical protein